MASDAVSASGAWNVPFAVADVPTAEELAPHLRWLAASGVSTGASPAVVRFEERLADELRVAEVVAVSNGTTGLRLMLLALGLSGDVIVSALAFPATYQAVRGAGLNTRFCDIEQSSLGIDRRAAADLVDERTSGIVAVHQFGRPCDVAGLTALSTERDLVLAFDSAAAYGQLIAGASVTSYGRASVLSFHWSKVLSCMEGGAVVTDDSVIAARVRELRNFGLRPDGPADILGENGKMSDLSALAGLVALDRLPDRLSSRAALHRAYEEGLAPLGVELLPVGEAAVAASATAVLPPDPVRTASELVSRLAAQGIQSRAYAGARFLPEGGGAFPARDALAPRLLSLPLSPALGEADVELVVAGVKHALAK
jgi:dTDP-4-amino-4,6-dideoxyglucose